MLRCLFLLRVIHLVISGRGNNNGFNDGCKRRLGLEQGITGDAGSMDRSRRQKQTPASALGDPGTEIPTMKQAMDEHSDCYRCAILAASWRQHIPGMN